MSDLKKMSNKALLAAANARVAAGEYPQWTKTPEGRERMRRSQKARQKELIAARWRAKTVKSTEAKPLKLRGPRGAKENVTHEEQIDHHFEQQLAYLYGRLESQAEVFASLTGYSLGDVAARLSELFSRKNVGKVVRSGHRLSGVR